jgi:hypothetical protein
MNLCIIYKQVGIECVGEAINLHQMMCEHRRSCKILILDSTEYIYIDYKKMVSKELQGSIVLWREDGLTLPVGQINTRLNAMEINVVLFQIRLRFYSRLFVLQHWNNNKLDMYGCSQVWMDGCMHACMGVCN